MSVALPSSFSCAPVRVMIIVARDRPELYEYFRAAFDGFVDVEVIVDRRIPEDRDDWQSCEVVSGGRWQPDVYDELTLRGFVVQRVQCPGLVPVDSSAPARHPLGEDGHLDGTRQAR